MQSSLRRAALGLVAAIVAWLALVAVFPESLMAPVAGTLCPAAVARAAESVPRPAGPFFINALDVFDGVPQEVRSCAVPLVTVGLAIATMMLVVLAATGRGSASVLYATATLCLLITPKAWLSLSVTAIYRTQQPGLEVFTHGLSAWPWPVAAQLGAVAGGVMLAALLRYHAAQPVLADGRAPDASV